MDQFSASLKQKGFKGDIDSADATRQLYSHDASLFEVIPELVVSPKDENDLQFLIRTVNENKKTIPDLSLTARSAGTCMSGGSINDSVIVDFRKYFTKIEEVTDSSARVQPGVLYRDFEKETLAHNNALLPSFPASRELASVGGMVANNSGGEKSLEFGKTENFVTGLKVILADGSTCVLRALSKPELDAKKAQQDFEGEIYRKMFDLLDTNYDAIKVAKPKVTKNSTGYNLWDVWDRQSGIFDLTKLFVGSQGTLGLVGYIQFRLIHNKPHSGVLVVFMKKKNMEKLGELINTVMAKKPASFEALDRKSVV